MDALFGFDESGKYVAYVRKELQTESYSYFQDMITRYAPDFDKTEIAFLRRIVVRFRPNRTGRIPHWVYAGAADTVRDARIW